MRLIRSLENRFDPPGIVTRTVRTASGFGKVTRHQGFVPMTVCVQEPSAKLATISILRLKL